jgi:protein-S-isoprenylcysteine O-methyltransferase Ste14
MNPDNGGPGALPPPVIYVAALLAGLALNYLWPVSFPPARWGYSIGTVLVIASVFIVFPVFLRFRRAGTPFDVRKPATALITDGPNRFSRNPGYVALTLLYLGVALLVSSLWALLLVVPALLVMDRWIVRREERHLEERFGEQYLRYKRTVRRWV